MGHLGSLRRARKDQRMMFGWLRKTPADIVRWEYKILPIGDAEDPDEVFIENQLLMDAMGGAGWELVALHHNHLIFKRRASSI